MSRAGRKRSTRALLVAMNGTEVGELRRVSGGELRFHYAPTWLERSTAAPISLSMPLSTTLYGGDVVWNFFENLLPDDRGIRRRMQRSLGADSTRPFDLLEQAGADCVGALQLIEMPSTGGPAWPDVRRVESTPLSDAWIAERLRTYREHPLGMAPDEDDFRISVAGAQEKAAFLWRDDAWHRPSGATPTTHIFKLPIGRVEHGIDLSDSVENEWLCLRIAAAFGLPVPPAEIHRFEDVTVLVVERFDRRWARDRSWIIRLPQEDTCQSLGVSPGRKYESDGGPGIAAIMELLLQSEQPSEDRAIFFRAVVVFWLLAAIDGHAKNFSVFLHPGGGCRLAPLYDILSAYPILAKRGLAPQEIKTAMAADGKSRHYDWAKILGRHWLSTARKARFPASDASAVLEDCVARIPAVIETAASELPKGFPAHVADPILEGIEATGRRLL